MRWSALIIAAMLASSASEGQVVAERELQRSERSQQRLNLILSRLKALRPAGRSNDAGSVLADVGKCGFRVSFDILGVWPYLSPQEQRDVAVLLDPPQLAKDTVIGRFRIHYEPTNVNGNEPALLDANGQRIPGTARAFVDSVGWYFNKSWTFEVDTLAYAAPPFAQDESYIHVYVQNLGNSIYGQTVVHPSQINPGQFPPRYLTYIEIHNDFQPFYSSGIEGLKVTAAHELHHAVQLGSYGYWQNDVYFYEITSTWMEDVVFDDVNDYHQYLSGGHFFTPNRSLKVANGRLEYSRAIWGKYVEKRFSRDAMRRTWELMRQEASFPSINRALGEYRSTLREAYAEFSLWNYFTGRRADSVNYYAEARQYPEIRMRDSLQFIPPISVFSNSSGVESFGATYSHVFLGPALTLRVAAIVMKTNIAEAGNGLSERFQYIMRTDPQGDESFTRLDLGGSVVWVKIGGVANANDWSMVHATDSSVLKPQRASVLVYPNPFYVSEQRWVRFELPTSSIGSGSLYIFSSDMRLVFSQDQNPQTTPLRPSFFVWDGRHGNGEYAATGAYFFVLDLDGEQYQGKFMILRK